MNPLHHSGLQEQTETCGAKESPQLLQPPSRGATGHQACVPPVKKPAPRPCGREAWPALQSVPAPSDERPSVCRPRYSVFMPTVS